jgi:hypothetical protein
LKNLSQITRPVSGSGKSPSLHYRVVREDGETGLHRRIPGVALSLTLSLSIYIYINNYPYTLGVTISLERFKRTLSSFFVEAHKVVLAWVLVTLAEFVGFALLLLTF